MVHHLVYVSSTPTPLSPDELMEILRVSRRNNAAVAVTGALLYSGGNVMQVLEGERADVDAVFARVLRDPRHRQVQVLLREDVPRRYFGEWSMGLGSLVREEGADDHEALNRVLHRDFDPESFGTDPQRAHRLMLSFRRMVERDLTVTP
jgi:hypothetical protein